MKKFLMIAPLALGMQFAVAGDDMHAEFKQMMDSSFKGNGIAEKHRLYQLDFQAACSTEKSPSPAMLKAIEAEQMKTIRWPSDGKYTGDWKSGEKIAISGRGLTWNDKADAVNGGGCYNCHQMSHNEISYGTIGPSLWNYGKIRGVTDVTSAAAAPIVQYTWGKLWNSKAYNACSNMPRFGHMALLNEGQIRDLMSLLLDPRSPVNQ